MKICNTILDTIGNTPLVRLNNVVKGVPATVLRAVLIRPTATIASRTEVAA